MIKWSFDVLNDGLGDKPKATAIPSVIEVAVKTVNLDMSDGEALKEIIEKMQCSCWSQ